MTKHTIPFGTSEPQDFELRDDGVAINGTGYTLTLEIMQRADGAAVDVPDDETPSVAWLSAAAGTVRVTGANLLGIGSYLVRYKLTSGSQVGYCPNGEKADLWQVVPVANW